MSSSAAVDRGQKKVVTAPETGNVNAGGHSALLLVSAGGSVEGSRRKGEGRCTRRHTGCNEEL